MVSNVSGIGGGGWAHSEPQWPQNVQQSFNMLSNELQGAQSTMSTGMWLSSMSGGSSGDFMVNVSGLENALKSLQRQITAQLQSGRQTPTKIQNSLEETILAVNNVLPHAGQGASLNTQMMVAEDIENSSDIHSQASMIMTLVTTAIWPQNLQTDMKNFAEHLDAHLSNLSGQMSTNNVQAQTLEGLLPELENETGAIQWSSPQNALLSLQEKIGEQLAQGGDTSAINNAVANLNQSSTLPSVSLNSFWAQEKPGQDETDTTFLEDNLNTVTQNIQAIADSL